ncbi:hypothetical protein UPYG_G00334910 [Umbra pygmaea]|uniref:Uncharacterized protein n=1 Tax=Umbra pygmaea TaxID=75934 RepID=A0ABD0WAB3_UMBPY
MKEYHLTPMSRLSTWFSGGSSRSPRGLWSTTPCPLPEWLCWAALSGAMAPLVLDVLEHRRVMLLPQVENSRLPSSHCSATAVRQALYGILLANQETGGSRGEVHGVQGHGAHESQGGRGRGGRGGGGMGRGMRGRGGGQEQGYGAGLGENNRCDGVEGRVCVEEYDRNALNLSKNKMEPRPPRTLLRLDTLSQAPVGVRLGVLCEVLGVKESCLAPLPPHLRLVVGVTGFWRREARPHPSLPQIQALLLGMVYGEMARNCHPGQNQKTAAERNIWIKLRLRPGDRRGLDLGAAHALSQWQACLWTVICLNQLLCLPLPEPDTALLFSGSLVHRLVNYLNGGCPPESVLAATPYSIQLYRSLLAALENCTIKTPNSSSASRTRGGGRGRPRGQGRRGGRGRGQKAPPTQEINNMFAQLMSEEEEDDEE